MKIDSEKQLELGHEIGEHTKKPEPPTHNKVPRLVRRRHAPIHRYAVR